MVKIRRRRFGVFSGRPLAGLLGVVCPAAVCWMIAAPLIAQVVPYSLPVTLPAPVQSPPTDSRAPYTPTVRSLIRQLEPGSAPTPQELPRAASVLSGSRSGVASCHNLGTMMANTVTSPRIAPLCFSDGLGINVIDGPNVRHTTGMPSMVALAASFDTRLANAMGQMEGREGRNLMVTGLLGPQADTDVFINWSRGLHTPGEDPWLNGVMVAAQINGIQGQGLMAQVKHFALYNGNDEDRTTSVQDQALHEILLPPYEAALTQGGASSVMCSYAIGRDTSAHLPAPVALLPQPSPYTGASPLTWPLNQAHYACEQPLTLTYVLRDLWHSVAFVDSDYGAVHDANDSLQGEDREDPGNDFFGVVNPRGHFLDPTGSTCADAAGRPVSCDAPGAQHVAGIPGPGCPDSGCSVGNAAANGTLPLSAFNQSLARVLYQEERFGLLGCDDTSAHCANPGGIDGNRGGTAPLPQGPTTGAPLLGTKNGDAAIVERVIEEGAVLLKNADHALPITAADLRRGIAVSGAGAEYLIANPTNEGAIGYADRNAINPLQQLRAMSGRPDAFVYTPANAPTGQVPGCALLWSQPNAPTGAPAGGRCTARNGLALSSGADASGLKFVGVDQAPDHTSVSQAGPLQGGRLYQWTGWLYVPRPDRYIFRFQYSRNMADGRLSFALDGRRDTIVEAASFYYGQYYGSQPVDVDVTNAGYTQQGLRNRQCASSAAPLPSLGAQCAVAPAVGWHQVQITLDALAVPAAGAVSFRFAVSRAQGDIDDAAAAARGRALALVFVNDHDRRAINRGPSPQGYGVSSLAEDQQRLIRAVAAANPRTVVVLNTGTPVVVKEWIDHPHVKALLNLWLTGQEGGTATARLLLGQADPSGHTTLTWPRDNDDTIEGYVQPRGLYGGDTAGAHPERLNGLPGGSTDETQGIYSGYRFYDELNIPVQFPFGFGLSYTQFKFSHLKVQAHADGTASVAFDLRNVGRVAGAEVAQVYVGPGPSVAGIQQAARALHGMARVELAPGQVRHVRIELDRRSFQYWSEAQQAWRIDPGSRRVYVGDADTPGRLPLSASIEVGAP